MVEERGSKGDSGGRESVKMIIVVSIIPLEVKGLSLTQLNQPTLNSRPFVQTLYLSSIILYSTDPYDLYPSSFDTITGSNATK